MFTMYEVNRSRSWPQLCSLWEV